MAKLNVLQSSLNAGEISPLLRGRQNVARYRDGLELCRNAIPLVTGGVTRRSGRRKVAQAAASYARLIPFLLTVEGVLVGYQIEATAAAFRFYRGGARLENAGVPVEVAHIFGETAVRELRYAQEGDTIYFSHPTAGIWKLTRTSDTAWIFEKFAPEKFPYFRPKGTKEITLAPSVTNGAGILTASAPLFAAGHVNARFQVNGGLATVTAVNSSTEAQILFEERIIVPNQMRKIQIDVTLGIDPALMTSGPQTVSVEFKTYRTETSPTLLLETDTIIPANESGITFSLASREETTDGNEIYYDTVTVNIDPAAMSGPRQVLFSGFGEMTDRTKKRAFSEDQVIVRFDMETNTSPNPLPPGVTKSTAKTSNRVQGTEEDKYWKEQCWSDMRGWPGAIWFSGQRMILGYTAAQATTIWGSRIGDFLEFTTGTLDDDPYSFTLAQASTRILHLAGSDEILALTADQELTLRGGNDTPISATNVQVKTPTNHGSSHRARPIKSPRGFMFISPDGSELRTIQYNLEVDGYNAPDIALGASHLMAHGNGIIEAVYAKRPIPTIWAVTATGRLLSCTYDPDQEVIAWAWHDCADCHYLSVSVSPDSTGADRVWIVILRDGAAYVEYLDSTLNTDSAVTGAGQVIGGLAHLEGHEVAIVGDGYVLPRQVVAGGQVDLGVSYAAVEVGLPFRTVIKDLPPAIEGGAGAAMSVNSVRVLLHESQGCTLNGEEIPFSQLDGTAPGELVLDTPVQPFTGWKTVNAITGWSTSGETAQVEIVQDLPLPLTVLAIVKEISANAG